MVQPLSGKRGKDPTQNSFRALDSDEDEDETQEQEDEEKVQEQEASDEDEDHGGFTEVVRKRKGASNTIGPHRIYSEEECREFSEMYNLWFKALTGKDLGFIITPSSQPYVSSFEACMLRDHVLSTLFDSRPNWIDPFGGSGGDTCAALFNLHPEKVFICEYMYTEDTGVKTREFQAMEHNINNMCREFDVLNDARNPSAPQVFMVNKKCEDFLRELDPEILIDILYLDPNWFKGGPLQETERSPKEMVTYLNYHVIKPLSGRKNQPKCIVFKTRWLSQVLWPFMKILTPDYHPLYSIEATPFRQKIDEKKFKEEGEVRGRFHWVVIVHNELKTLHWAKSEVYKDLFINRKDVFIEEADLIQPRIPAYAGIVPLPKKSKRTSGEGLIHLRPPKRQPTQKGRGGHTRSTMSRFKTRPDR